MENFGQFKASIILKSIGFTSDDDVWTGMDK